MGDKAFYLFFVVSYFSFIILMSVGAAIDAEKIGTNLSNRQNVAYALFYTGLIGSGLSVGIAINRAAGRKIQQALSR